MRRSGNGSIGLCALLLGLALTACTSVGTPPPVALGRFETPHPEPEGAVTITIYLPRLFDDQSLGLQAVERRLAPTVLPARTSLEALIDGPNGDERAANFQYAFHPRTQIVSVETAAGTATIEVAEDRQFRVHGRPFSELVYWSIVYSLTASPGIERVALVQNGAPLLAFGDPPLTIPATAGRGQAPDWVRPRGT